MDLRNISLKLEPNMSLVNIADQLQKFSSKYLCVFNEQTLTFFTKDEPGPQNVRLDSIVDNIYTFSNFDQTIKFVVFSLEAAQVFCPRIQNQINAKQQQQHNTNNQIIKIIEQEKELSFSYSERKSETRIIPLLSPK